MKQQYLGIVILAATLALSGCGLFGKKKNYAPVTSPPESGDTAGSTSGYGSEGVPPPAVIGGSGSATPLSATAGSLGESIIYFEFDSFEVNDAGRAVIDAYGRYLAANPALKVRLEGHADERGTREYNVGLGERRANAVMQGLLGAGAVAGQLSVVSYGEERPAVPGHDEEAWTRNRRVELVR